MEPTEAEPETPECVEHVEQWFWLLSQRRTHGMESPNAISFSDIEAWTRLTGTLVLPEEIHMILAMDDAYIAALSKVREEHRAKDK